jgi:predicted lipoprotein with Yx(FWY)xxD motif
MQFTRARSILGAAALLTLAGCGGAAATSASGGAAATSASGGSGGGGAGNVGSTQVSLGTVLTGPSGNTLYVLLSAQGTSVPCTATCPSLWPPLTMASGTTPQAGSGVSASLAVMTISDGTKQVTANGNPLYYYTGDSGSGQVKGEGINSFGGIWYAVQPSGQPAKTGASSAGTGATPTSSGGGAYGY